MSERLASALAAIARPALAVSGALLVAGSLLAAAGIAAGWPFYLAGYASMAVTLPAVAAAHKRRLGRLGTAVFALATVNVVVGTPVVAMVTTYVLGIDGLHLALMGYVMTPVGMIGSFGINLSIVLVGLAIVRARVFPAAAGWLLVAGAILEFPVEFGVLPLPVWAAAMSVLAVAFGIIARELGEPAARRSPAIA